jgi:small-conductance mechanosensitive channel
VLAFLIALPMVGIDLTVLSVFGGALGVGLGLGLQKIASNYVSGFILLMDRSLRIGDLIQIGDRAGQVSGLTARYIILKSLDGTASLIPNDTIITSVVINQTYTDRNVRVGIPIQVAYGSDLHLVMQLMMQATEGHSRILTNPPAGVVLKEFAESGINVELGFWVADSELGTGILRSQINLQIWESFVANNIEMPYPRRDISIVSMPHSE